METLRDIIDILKSHSFTLESDSAYSLRQAPKLYRLLEAIYLSEVTSDEDAIQLLYNNSNKRRNYTEIKRRLKRKLLDCLIVSGDNYSAASDLRSAFYQCSRDWIASTILRINQKHRSAVTLLEKICNISQKYELSQFVVLSSNSLSYIYSAVLFDEYKREKFSKISQKAHEALNAESAISSVYGDLMLQFSKTQSRVPDKVLTSIYSKLESIYKAHEWIKTYEFARYYFLTKTLYLEASNQYSQSIDCCNDAISCLHQKPFDTTRAERSFQLRKLVAQIYLGNYQDSTRIYSKFIPALHVGSLDWLTWQYYYFILNCYSRNYHDAMVTASSTIRSKYFNKQHDYRKQMWFVLEAFMQFLISVGKVSEETIEKHPLRPFRLFRFLNDVPIFSKDKRGINISIIIIQILFFLTKRQHDKIRDRVDSLNQYCRRYLYRDDTFRSSCFIKMLTELPKANFNRMRAERYAQKHVKRLATMPIDQTRQGIETEPVPYEHLWEMIVEQLD